MLDPSLKKKVLQLYNFTCCRVKLMLVSFSALLYLSLSLSLFLFLFLSLSFSVSLSLSLSLPISLSLSLSLSLCVSHLTVPPGLIANRPGRLKGCTTVHCVLSPDGKAILYGSVVQQYWTQNVSMCDFSLMSEDFHAHCGISWCKLRVPESKPIY